MDYYKALDFVWQCNGHKEKCRLARWSILCKPKCIGFGNFKPGSLEQMPPK